jgi:hypothetical protein
MPLAALQLRLVPSVVSLGYHGKQGFEIQRHWFPADDQNMGRCGAGPDRTWQQQQQLDCISVIHGVGEALSGRRLLEELLAVVNPSRATCTHICELHLFHLPTKAIGPFLIDHAARIHADQDAPLYSSRRFKWR